MTRRQPVTFENRAGQTLHAILHAPEPARSGTGVVLLSPGIKSRVAPHRLYWKMARRFSELGFPVLRFDFSGLGDSEGRIEDHLMADLYRGIQLGRYVDETLDAIQWFREKGGVDRVVLAGLCGGAITGLLAAARCTDVAGVLGIGLPVTLDGSAVDKVAMMSDGQLRGVRQKYLRKVTDRSSWRRVLTFKTDFRLLAHSLGLVRRPRVTAVPGTGPTVLGGNGNPAFPPALAQTLTRGVPVLLVYGGADRLYWDYREKFAEPQAAFLEAFGDVLNVHVIDRANHVLTFDEWQQELHDTSRAWLEQWFLSSSPRPRPSPVALGQD
jgi:uncharacterized protein